MTCDAQEPRPCRIGRRADSAREPHSLTSDILNRQIDPKTTITQSCL
jgi:hypothetical protein